MVEPDGRTVTVDALAGTTEEITTGYRLATTSRFQPQVSIEVPDDTANEYVNQTFSVSFAQSGTERTECTMGTHTHMYRVEMDTNVATAVDEPPHLIYDPDTNDAMNALCTYTATFHDSVEFTLADSSMATLDLEGSSTAAISDPTMITRSYQARVIGNFAPSLFVRVPYVEQNGEAVLAGATINVTYNKAAGAPNGCTDTTANPQSETLTVVAGSAGFGGVAVPLPSDQRTVSLRDAAPGEMGRCTYTANFAPNFSVTHDGTQYGPYNLSSANDVEFTEAGGVTAVYSNDVVFFPTFSFTVPSGRDAVTNVSNYAGGVLAMTVAVADGPASGGCTTGGDGGSFRMEFTVTDDGLLGTEEGRPAMWVDVPNGEVDNCVYDVTLEEEIPSPMGVTPSWTLYAQARPELSVSAAVVTHNAEYGTRQPRDSFFPADVTISVPQYNGDDDPATDPLDESTQNAFVGEEFEVTFRRKDTNESPVRGCNGTAPVPPVTTTFVVGANGRVTPVGGAPQLINTPKYETGFCVYLVVFPSTERDGTRLALQSDDLDTTTRTIGRAATATYRATQADFVPPYALEALPFVDNGSGANALAGTLVTVDFTLKVTVPSQHPNCSASGRDVRVLGAGGDATNGGVLDASHTSRVPARLVDRPAGEDDPCVYIVHANDITHATHGAWEAVTNDEEYRRSPIFTIRYQTAQTTFTPDVSIVVPRYNGDGADVGRNAFAGRTFGVAFEPSGGPAMGCSMGESEMYVVRDTGDVVPQDGTDPVLVHQPPGVSEGCEYEVTYDLTSGTDPVLTRVSAGLVTSTSDADKATGATYEAEQTSFMPSLIWRVPFLDGTDTDSDNDFNNQTITVDYARVSGAHMDCTAMAQEMYTVGSGVDSNDRTTGVVTGPDAARTLVDRPAGEDDRCEYTVDVTDSITASGGEIAEVAAGSDNQSITGGASLTVRFSRDTTFTPTVTIEVPQYDRDGAAGTNWYEGTSFTVTFTAKTGAGLPSGCSEGPMPGSAVSKEYVVGMNGTVTPVDGVPSLVDVPSSAGASERCTYDVALPLMTSSAQSATAGSASNAVPEWTLRIKEATTEEVSNADVAGGSATVERSYEADAIWFASSVAVMVPQIDGTTAGENLFNGHTFEVTVAQAAGADADCSLGTAETVRFTVGATGAVTGTPPRSLIDRPQGQSARCRYAVTFPPMASSAPGAALPWALVPDAETATLGAGDETGVSVSVTGAYETTVDVTYVPDVTLAMPFVDDDSDSQNDLADQEVMVTYVPVAGSSQECVSGRSDTFTIGAGGAADTGGEVTLPATRAQLVHLPMGGDAACSYTADATDSITTSGGTAIDIEADSDNQLVTASSGAITITYGDAPAPEPEPEPGNQQPGDQNQQPDDQQPGDQNQQPDDQQPGDQNQQPDDQQQNPPANTQQQNTQPPARQQSRTPTGGGGSRGGGGGGSRGGGGSSTPRETGPFVPSATQRVPVGVSLTLPADVFVEPTPIEVLINVPDECGTDVRTFEGLAASVGLVYVFDASSGATADIITAGARQIAAFAERGTTQRPCALRVTLLSAPAGCTLGAAAGTDPAAASTDDAGRSYVELATGDDAAALNLTPALTCT